MGYHAPDPAAWVVDVTGIAGDDMDMAVHHALARDVADVCADDRASWEYRSSSIILHLLRGSKAKDPHQLRVNSYRVLLTWGRDGFAIFVFNEIGMHSTYEVLKGIG